MMRRTNAAYTSANRIDTINAGKCGKQMPHIPALIILIRLAPENAVKCSAYSGANRLPTMKHNKGDYNPKVYYSFDHGGSIAGSIRLT